MLEKNTGNRTLGARLRGGALICGLLACLGYPGISPTAAKAEGFFAPFEKTAAFPAIDEFRFGVLAHQVEDSPGEEGVDINLEILFGRPARHYSHWLLEHYLRPRPHIGASINTNGDTSQVYAGVTWDIKLTDRMFFESTFGGALHNGPHDGDEGESSFGCTLNFRESASLGFVLSERWRLLLTVDHMSNAGLCDENRGITNAGVRFGYKW